MTKRKTDLLRLTEIQTDQILRIIFGEEACDNANRVAYSALMYGVRTALEVFANTGHNMDLIKPREEKK